MSDAYGVIQLDKFTPQGISKLWERAMSRGPYPNASSNAGVAIELNAAQMIPQLLPAQEKLNAEARSATDILLKWCRQELYPSDLPHLRVYFSEQTALEQALVAARHIMNGKPHRRPAWFHHARWIWPIASRQLVQLGRQGGVSQSSVAIKFTCLVLREMGFSAVTPTAVSGSMRKYRLPASST